MFEKINPSRIIIAHLGTLRHAGKKQISKSDVFLFFGLTLAMALTLFYFGFQLSAAAVGVLVTALSVFAGLLLNVLLLIYDIMSKSPTAHERANNSKTQKEEQMDSLKATILLETYHNISFAIFLAVATLSFLVFTVFIPERWDSIKEFASILVFWLVLVFLTTLLMILKRVHGLLSKEMASEG